jgi:3-hydroxybutyryl-CoA dehydratase
MSASTGRFTGFGAFAVGDTVEVTTTVTAEHFAVGPSLFGDTHPMHVDDEYARERGHPSRILPGTVISGIASGPLAEMLRQCGLALLKYDCRFRAPVYLGDRLTARTRVTGLEPKPHRGGGLVFLTTSVENQDGVLVGEVDAIDLVSDVPAA